MDKPNDYRNETTISLLQKLTAIRRNIEWNEVEHTILKDEATKIQFELLQRTSNKDGEKQKTKKIGE